MLFVHVVRPASQSATFSAHSSMSVQFVTPSPRYPLAHAHEKLPSRLVHTPLVWQSCGNAVGKGEDKLHSSTSVQYRPSPQ